ncbi:hypothetical protein ACI65C_002567 [Semiaphis heraclei]
MRTSAGFLELEQNNAYSQNGIIASFDHATAEKLYSYRVRLSVCTRECRTCDLRQSLRMFTTFLRSLYRIAYCFPRVRPTINLAGSKRSSSLTIMHVLGKLQCVRITFAVDAVFVPLALNGAL